MFSSPMKTLASRGLLTFSLRNSPIVMPGMDVTHFVKILDIFTLRVDSPEHFICYPASGYSVILAPALIQMFENIVKLLGLLDSNSNNLT